MIIRMNLNDQESLLNAEAQLREYAAALESKARQICERLAAIGATRASLDYARVPMDGFRDVEITVEESGNGYRVLASGETVLFLEFGAGKMYGYGHPSPMGFGTGSWPDPHFSYNSNGEKVENWKNDRGWWIPKEHGGGHTYGNPPAMGMYNAGREMRDMIQQVAEEVLRS